MTKPSQTETQQARRVLAEVTEQIADLSEMNVAALRDKYREVFGEPSRSRNKAYLRKKIAWRIQELAEGGLSDRALARIDELAADVPIGWGQRFRRSRGKAAATTDDITPIPTEIIPRPKRRDPRLPEPGAVLSRTYQGTEHRIQVLEDGFDFQGKRYTSLSKIAREITGTQWNGYLFFGLQRRGKGSKENAA